MAVKKKKAAMPAEETSVDASAFLKNRATYKEATVWLVGDSPLIVHAWAEKAKREMLDTHTKKPRAGKVKREPDKEFQACLYRMKDGHYGFPANGIKRCLLMSAHKDKGMPRD